MFRDIGFRVEGTGHIEPVSDEYRGLRSRTGFGTFCSLTV